jgi:hypothetical protein
VSNLTLLYCAIELVAHDSGHERVGCENSNTFIRGHLFSMRRDAIMGGSYVHFPVWSKNSISLKTRDIVRLVSKAPCQR